MPLRASIRVALVAALLAAMFGCGGGGGGTKVDKPTYRLINSSPDTPALDVSINDDKKGDALPYGGSTPNFATLKADLYDVTLRPVGAAEDAWSEAFNFPNGTDTAVVAFGLSSFGDEFFKRLRLSFIPVDRHQPNGSRARLIIVNGFNRKTGFDNVPVDFKNPGDNPQNAVRNIGVGAFQVLETDSGTQTFELRITGAEQVFVTKDLDLQSGKIYLVLLTGIEEATGAQAPDIKLVELQSKS